MKIRLFLSAAVGLRGREIKIRPEQRPHRPSNFPARRRWMPQMASGGKEGERDSVRPSVRPKGAFVEIHTPLPPSFLPSLFLSIPCPLSPSLHVKPRRPPPRCSSCCCCLSYNIPSLSSLSHTSLNWQVDRTRRALISSAKPTDRAYRVAGIHI